MKFSRETLRQIRERTDFTDLVGGYTRLTRRGDRWWGLSPFKSEKTPSFTVKPEEGFYYCFATQKGGDIFRFVSEMEGISFPEAVRFLAERAGVPLEEEPEDPHRKDRDAMYELYKRVAGTFAWFLWEAGGRTALQYIRDRGVDDEGIRLFQLGHAPDSPAWLYRFLRSKSYSDAFLEKSGLFSRRKREYPLFRNRLIFPITDDRDRVLAFGGRALSPGERAKYLNSPDTMIYNKKQSLYGLAQAKDTIRAERRVYVAEGYLDVIALNRGGLTNAVAPLGTALTEHHVKLLKRWADEIVLVFDADQAGLSASFRASLIVEEAGLGCHVLPLETGTDPADVYRDEGAEGLSRRLEALSPAFSYLLETAAARVDLNDSRGRELLLRKIFPYITVVRSEVRRETLLEQVADVLRVSAVAVRHDFDDWNRGDIPGASPGGEARAGKRRQSRDYGLVLACVQKSEFFALLRNVISCEDLDDAEAKRVFIRAEDAFRHGESFPRAVLDRMHDERLRNDVLQRITSGEYSGWDASDVEVAIRNIRIRKLEEKQRLVEAELRTVKPEELQETRHLLERKMAIDQELSQLKVRVDD